MSVYIYDGTFEGFLSVVFQGWHRGRQTVEQILPAGQTELFGTSVTVNTDAEEGRRVLEGLWQKAGGEAVQVLVYAFHNEVVQHKEMTLWRYVQAAFYYGPKVVFKVNEEAVEKTLDWYRTVGNERHCMLGLTRFQELADRTLYAPMAPRHDVVGLMAGHFKRRFPWERWVLHDVRRKKGICCEDGKVWPILIPQLTEQLVCSEGEKEFASLWKAFHSHIAIAERSNKTLQQQNMPAFYWKYLTEM